MKNPIVLIAIGLLLGVGTGTGWFFMSAKKLIAARVVVPAEPGAGHVEMEAADSPWGFWTVEIDNLATELKDQRAGIKKREEAVAAREARLAADQVELTQLRTQIEGLQKELSTRFIEIQADEAKNLKTLATTYSNVTPKSAVTIFREMDDQTIVKIMSLMKTDVTSAIFEEMAKAAATEPQLAKRAAAISEKIRALRAARTAAS